jgi:hypothetical protein
VRAAASAYVTALLSTGRASPGHIDIVSIDKSIDRRSKWPTTLGSNTWSELEPTRGLEPLTTCFARLASRCLSLVPDVPCDLRLRRVVAFVRSWLDWLIRVQRYAIRYAACEVNCAGSMPPSEQASLCCVRAEREVGSTRTWKADHSKGRMRSAVMCREIASGSPGAQRGGGCGLPGLGGQGTGLPSVSLQRGRRRPWI